MSDDDEEEENDEEFQIIERSGKERFLRLIHKKKLDGWKTIPETFNAYWNMDTKKPTYVIVMKRGGFI
jgi:hypothetical protein